MNRTGKGRVISAVVVPQERGCWQPIGTAPKDGTPVIATWQDTWADVGTRTRHIHIEGMYFDADGWWYSYDGDGPSRAPTHWMPLPEPPEPRP